VFSWMYKLDLDDFHKSVLEINLSSLDTQSFLPENYGDT
jgi:hypothetical protein